jgi:hypothetical protein
MAKKINESKLAQESRGQAEVTNRVAAAVPAVFYLMQARSPRLRISPPKKRLTVLSDAETRDAVPCPVKIRHLG